MTAVPTESSWRTQRRRLLPAATIGTVLEWYDMFVYAQAASLIFAKLFFPDIDPVLGTLASLATFGVGYVARPLGAIVFGYVGDRFGRKVALSATLILMGVATTLIGVLPTYATAGLVAPILLVILRLAQGLGSGAEYSGSFVMIAEITPPKSRGFWTAVPGTGVYGGIVLATLVGLTVFRLPDDQLYSWGWRLPFLVSFVLIVIGIIMRLRITESPVFKQFQERKARHTVPALAVLKKSPLTLVLAIFLTAPIAFNAYMSSTYALNYGVEHGVSTTGVLIGALLGAMAALVCTLIAGKLSDRFGRRAVFITMTAIGAVGTLPYFLLLGAGSDGSYWIAQAFIMAPFTQALTGAQAAFLAELFKPEFRYTGVAMSREFCTAIFTSIAPIAGLALVTANGGQPWLLAGVMSVVSLLGLIAAVLLPETRGVDMTEGAATQTSIQADSNDPDVVSGDADAAAAEATAEEKR
ncbi:MFS transporter [Schumannella sp. 10F1B-5-1]|uniref:MFS transporter n=1 Tax=Schumannella sp. 10F1B-5-1 TaxID=2590780 RepID=UPI00112FFD3B|nr:MFS transporter [Schumannella sp. 10F1B-5-1]TPW78247.1 MHS family MFS transporter [Schumannella sp. 10F1B-5-1]